MSSFNRIIIFLLFFTFGINGKIHTENDYGGSARRVNVADKDVLQLYQKWIDTGLSSLIAAIANQK